MEKYVKFESLRAFEDYLNSHKPTKYYQTYNAQSQTEGRADWYGTKSFTQAEALFKKGDMKIASEIATGVIQTTAASKRRTNRLQTSVVGMAPHVPNYIAGRPNSMINMISEPKKVRVITAMYNISVNGGVSPESMKKAAVQMLSAIKILEDNGVRVNLYLADLSKRNDDIIGWSMKIKSSSQHLDVLKTAYPLCNPSMLRRHSFRFTEVTEHDFGYGQYGSAVKDTTELCKQTGIRNAVSISYYDLKTSYTTKEQMFAEAKKLAETILKRASTL